MGSEQDIWEHVGRSTAERHAGRRNGYGRRSSGGGFGHGVIGRFRSGVDPLGATAEGQLLVVARAGCFRGHLGCVVETVAA